MRKEFGLALKDVNLSIMRVLQKRFIALGLDLTPTQGRIIFCLYDHSSEMCQKDLEKILRRNKSTLSSTLDSMERNGYILRREDSIDSRKNIIMLTDKSLEVVKVLNADKDYINSQISQGITDSEYEVFCKVLEKIEKNIEGM